MKTRGLALSVLLLTLTQVERSISISLKACSERCIRKAGGYPVIDCKHSSSGRQEFEGSRRTLEDGKKCVAAPSEDGKRPDLMGTERLFAAPPLLSTPNTPA